MTEGNGHDQSVSILTCVRASVALQVKSVVESLATEGAQIAFYIRVAFEVSVKKPGQCKSFPANRTFQWVVAGARLVLVQFVLFGGAQKRVLYAMTTIDELKGGDHVQRNS